MSNSKALIPTPMTELSSATPSVFPTTAPSIGDIDAYVRAVNALPILTQEEELALATRFQQEGDLRAAETLVLSNLRYVARIAHQYKGYGLAFADLVQEGSIGLMKAVKRFNPSVGVRLVTFAVHWIKSEIHDFVISNWRIVKIATTKAQRKLFFNLSKQKKEGRWFSQKEAQEVAEKLDVTPRDVQEMELRVSAQAQDMAFDMTDDDDAQEENSAVAPAQYLAASELNPLDYLENDNSFENAHEKLSLALEKLDARSQDIITKRWLQEDKKTLKDLAEDYQVSVERVRQIENAALQKLQEYCS